MHPGVVEGEEGAEPLHAEAGERAPRGHVQEHLVAEQAGGDVPQGRHLGVRVIVHRPPLRVAQGQHQQGHDHPRRARGHEGPAPPPGLGDGAPRDGADEGAERHAHHDP